MFEVGAAVLGYVGITASWRRSTADYAKRYGPMLVIQQSSGTEDGCHEPAASITIRDREGLLALRDAIDQALIVPTGAAE
jgi:hypothetical protein